jgi:hypothetical protein
MSVFRKSRHLRICMCSVQAERTLLEGQLKQLSETEVVCCYTLYYTNLFYYYTILHCVQVMHMQVTQC